VGKLDVTLKTQGLRGKVGRRVTLTTNDPEREKSFLTIQANITGSIVMLPHSKMSVGSGRGRNQVNRVIVRKDPTEEGELVVSGFQADQEWLLLTARKVETEEPGTGGFPTALPGDWILELALDESAPEGHTRANVGFSTGLPREPQVKVPVQVSVLAPVNIRPKSLLVSPAASGEGLQGEVMAVLRAGLSPEELEIDSTPEVVKVEKEKTGARHFRVRATLPESAMADNPKLVVRVGEGWRIEIPIVTGATPSSSPAVAP
jgi:hypothetical protein